MGTGQNSTVGNVIGCILEASTYTNNKIFLIITKCKNIMGHILVYLKGLVYVHIIIYKDQVLSHRSGSINIKVNYLQFVCRFHDNYYGNMFISQLI